MREFIGGEDFGRMIICAASAIEIEKQKINELNVFPVPDGDTGTNMCLTIGTASAELRKKCPATLTKAADVTSNMLLRGARGNSGVILSLLFRGFAKSLKGVERADSVQFAAALREGVDTAYKAVMKPTEGTILTVSRLAGDAAVEHSVECADIEELLEHTISAANEALAHTVEQNPVLKKAGVVDAGGKGYICILEGMLGALRGVEYDLPEVSDVNDQADFTIFSDEEITFAYDTVFIVRKHSEDTPLEGLRAYLNSIGDSLVIGESDEEFKVHVHTNTPGDALTEAQKYGTLELARIENMRTQYEDVAAGRKARTVDELDQEHEQEHAHEAEPERVIAEPEKKYGAVAVCAGEGLEAMLLEIGADGVVTGGQTMNPSTEDILREIDRTPAEVVFVLPNNKNIIMAAQQCVPLSDKKVIVIETRTVPQGIAALLMLDTYADEQTNIEAMTEAAANVRTASVTYAARDAEFDGQSMKAGDYLMLLDGALCPVTNDERQLFENLAEQAAEFEPELITVYYGEEVTEEQAQKNAEVLSEKLPDAEVVVVFGGQPVYYYLISIE